MLSFLEHKFDLQGTNFSQEDLEYARRYWQFLIERVEPEWLETPQGRLAVHWESETIPSVVRLIHLAYLLNTLAGNIKDESDSTFGDKLRQLLFSDDVQHEEQITEFLVGVLLARLSGVSPSEPVTPIEMEPVSEAGSPDPATSKNVDYRIEWDDDGPIYSESTVFHIQRLLDWQSAVDTLKRRFERAMVRRNLNRGLEITAPLELTHKTLSVQEIDEALQLVETQRKGSYSIKLDQEDLTLEWSPVPHLEAPREKRPGSVPGYAFTGGAGVKVSIVAATTVTLKWPGNTEKLVNKSLRNTLDSKRKQFELEAPYLLNMRILSSHIPLEGVFDLLNRRIFNNEQYSWISAVNVLKIPFSQQTGYRLQSYISVNHKASNPLPKSFIDTVTQKG